MLGRQFGIFCKIAMCLSPRGSCCPAPTLALHLSCVRETISREKLLKQKIENALKFNTKIQGNERKKMVKAGFTKNNQKVHTHTDIHTYIHRHTERNERRQEQFDALQTMLITPFLPKGTTTATARGGPMFPDSPTPTNHPHRPPSHFLTHCCCTASDEFSRYTFTFIHL